MRLLALETTTAQGSLAWWEDGGVRAACDLQAGRYSVQLFAAMQALARQAGRELSSVDGFAVANGPGSFTGVRVGLTAVKGLVEVWRKPAVAISTLAAVAAAAAEMAGAEPVIAALDAARGDVYFRLPAAGGENPPEPLDRLESLVALCPRFPAWPEVRLATPHPDLAAACSRRLGPQFARRIIAVPSRLAPAVARLGAAWLAAGAAWEPDAALRLDANYVRRSDAEIFAAPLTMAPAGPIAD